MEIGATPSQPAKRTSLFTDSLMKIAIAIITFCATGILSFLWKINSTISVLEERDIEKSNKIDNLQISVNQVRMSQQDSREKVITMDYRLQNIENLVTGNKK